MLCASPAYLRKRGAPQTPRELETHDCLRYRFPATGKLQDWRLGTPQRAEPVKLPVSLACNNMEALRDAAIRGLGIVHMPDFLGCDAIAAGRLRTVLDGYLGIPGQFSILWPWSRRLSPKVRVLVDFLSERLFVER